MVRLVFRPFSQLCRVICTSTSKRTSTRVFLWLHPSHEKFTIFRVLTDVLWLNFFTILFFAKKIWDQNRPVVPSIYYSSHFFTFISHCFWKLVLFDLNQNTCTYVKLLGPCYKTGHLRSFFAKASWTCQLLLSQRDLHQSWMFERFFNLFIHTTIIWELTANMKAFPPSPNTLESCPPRIPHEKDSFPHTLRQLKQNNCCPQWSPKWFSENTLRSHVSFPQSFWQ